MPEVIMDYFGDGKRFGINIKYHVTSVDDFTISFRRFIVVTG